MTKEEDQHGSIDDLFNGAEVISSYTDRQAVEDGILFDVQELATVSPRIKWEEGPFSYVTGNLCFSKGYLKEGESANVPNFLDLFRQVGEAMRKRGPDHFYDVKVEFPNGTRGTVYAVQNESGRYTILMPEDY